MQGSANSNRVVRSHLSSEGLQVISTEILEHRTPLVSSPSTGAIAGGNFYFIANTGGNNLRNGKIVDVTKLEPVQIVVVPLDQ